MVMCKTDGFTLELPDDWSDRTMVTWVAPARSGSVAPNLLCSRAELNPDESLGAFVNRQLRELMVQIRHFELISRNDTVFGGRPAVEIVYCMKPRTLTLKQRQIFLLPRDGSPVVQTFVMTSTRDEYDELTPVFDAIFRSVVWE